MKFFSVVFGCAYIGAVSASVLKRVENNQDPPRDERQLQQYTLKAPQEAEVAKVTWLFEVILPGGLVLDPYSAVCTVQGKVTVPFFSLMKDTANLAATKFLQKFVKKNGIPESEVVWYVNDFSNRREMSENGDEDSRELLGFSWTVPGFCRRYMCNPDNKDGRRLGSSNSSKSTLSDAVAKSLLAVMKTRCGLNVVDGVTFNLIEG
jgi:hypothetical protein